MVDHKPNISEKIVDDTFVAVKTLGMGFTSEVVLAKHIDTGYKLALKIFKPIKQYKILLENFRKEVDSMKNLRHINLVNVIAANENGVMLNDGQKESIIYLGVELAENAELFDYIADPGKEFSENLARHYFKQILSGLKYMHDQGIAHRDLKTENLFLNSEFLLKIGDFGFSKFMDSEKNNGKLKTILGTSGYQSPEMLEGQLYNGASNDIFAIGVILFILVKAYPPFREAKKNDNWYRHLYYEKFDFFWQNHSRKGAILTKELKELIEGTLRYKNRWTIDNILNCDWMKGECIPEDEFLNEMNLRKKIVDARRDNDAREAQKAVSKIQGNILYRGDDEEENFKEVARKLNDFGVETINPKIWDHHPSRYLLINQGTNVYDHYHQFIKHIVNESGEIDISDTDFKFEATIDIKLQDIELTDNEKCTCAFTAQFYVDYDNDRTLIELMKDRSTNIFSFNYLFEMLSSNGGE